MIKRGMIMLPIKQLLMAVNFRRQQQHHKMAKVHQIQQMKVLKVSVKLLIKNGSIRSKYFLSNPSTNFLDRKFRIKNMLINIF